MGFFDFLKPKPKPKEYYISPCALANLLSPLNLGSMDLLDGNYWYYGLNDWVKALSETRTNMPGYILDKFDCDDFAFVTSARVILERKINTCGVAIGDSPQGYHAWNLVLTDDGIYFYEPQNGNLWKWPGTAGYIARRVIFP